MMRSEAPTSKDVLHIARKVGSWCKKKGGSVDKEGEREEGARHSPSKQHPSLFTIDWCSDSKFYGHAFIKIVLKTISLQLHEDNNVFGL